MRSEPGALNPGASKFAEPQKISFHLVNVYASETASERAPQGVAIKETIAYGFACFDQVSSGFRNTVPSTVTCKTGFGLLPAYSIS